MVDGELQRPGLKQQQRTERVEERLEGLWQVCILVRYEPWWQGVLFELLHRHICQSRAKRLQHRQREHRVIGFSEGIYVWTANRRPVNSEIRTGTYVQRLCRFISCACMCNYWLWDSVKRITAFYSLIIISVIHLMQRWNVIKCNYSATVLQYELATLSVNISISFTFSFFSIHNSWEVEVN